MDFDLPPTKTVMVHGFDSSDLIDSFVSSFPDGDLADFYYLSKNNILFLLFNDIRTAIKFHNSRVQNLSFSFTISKYEIPKQNESCSEGNFQSSVCFSLQGAEEDESLLLSHISNFVEIKDMRIIQGDKVVEFYSITDARHAYNSLNGTDFNGGTLVCRWEWDISHNNRKAYVLKTDTIMKRHLYPSTNKRVKINVESSKNPFIRLFDKFIVENLNEIERNI